MIFSRAPTKKGLIGKFCEHFHVICPCIQMRIHCSIFNEMLVFMATREHYKSSTQLSFQMYILNSSVFSFSCWFQFACLCLCQTVSTFVCFLLFFLSSSLVPNQPTNKQTLWLVAIETKATKKKQMKHTTVFLIQVVCKNLTQFTFFKMLRSHKTKMQFHKIYVCCSAPL